MSERTTAILLIAVVALGAVTGVAAADGGLEVAVDTDADGTATVEVTENDTAVANATVLVSVVDKHDENASYAGTGEYETDENGTVEPPAADEDITVDVTAAYGNESVPTTVGLTAEEDDEAEAQPFGQLVREFIEDLEDRDGGIGAAVSDFVTENNPGNAPDHAGGPSGPDEAGDGDDDGNESDAPGNGNAPDHAGPGGESDESEEDDADGGSDEQDDSDDGSEGDDADDESDDQDDADDDESDDQDAEEGEAEEDESDDGDEEADDAEEDEEADDDDEEDDGEPGPPDHAGGPGGD